MDTTPQSPLRGPNGLTIALAAARDLRQVVGALSRDERVAMDDFNVYTFRQTLAQLDTIVLCLRDAEYFMRRDAPPPQRSTWPS